MKFWPLEACDGEMAVTGTEKVTDFYGASGVFRSISLTEPFDGRCSKVQRTTVGHLHHHFMPFL